MSASHRHGAEGLAKRASYPTRQLITPRYAPTTGSGVRAVRCGLSELTQRGTKREFAAFAPKTASSSSRTFRKPT